MTALVWPIWTSYAAQMRRLSSLHLCCLRRIHEIGWQDTTPGAHRAAHHHHAPESVPSLLAWPCLQNGGGTNTQQRALRRFQAQRLLQTAFQRHLQKRQCRKCLAYICCLPLLPQEVCERVPESPKHGTEGKSSSSSGDKENGLLEETQDENVNRFTSDGRFSGEADNVPFPWSPVYWPNKAVDLKGLVLVNHYLEERWQFFNSALRVRAWSFPDEKHMISLKLCETFCIETQNGILCVWSPFLNKLKINLGRVNDDSISSSNKSRTQIAFPTPVMRN